MSKIVIASGYFNPLHKGHISYLTAARELGDDLWVILNNDTQVKLKGSVPFMTMEERGEIVYNLKPVNHVLYSIDDDLTVCQSLWYILFHYTTNADSLIFANGGDREKENTPEEEVCKKYNIEMIFGVGGEQKENSSSNLIRKVAENVRKSNLS